MTKLVNKKETLDEDINFHIINLIRILIKSWCKSVFNKESCRSCGEFLVADMICIECDEIILWVCSNCTNTSEGTHIHNQDKNIKNIETNNLDIQ